MLDALLETIGTLGILASIAVKFGACFPRQAKRAPVKHGRGVY